MSDSEPFRPRAHDHLVEPMFAGLGVDGADERAEGVLDGAADEPRPGLLARIAGGLASALRRVFA